MTPTATYKYCDTHIHSHCNKYTHVPTVAYQGFGLPGYNFALCIIATIDLLRTVYNSFVSS